MKKVLKLINNERNSLTVKSLKAQSLDCQYIDNAVCTVKATDYCSKYDFAGCFGTAIDYCETNEYDTHVCGPIEDDLHF